MVGITYRKDTNIWYCQIRIPRNGDIPPTTKYIGWSRSEHAAKKIYDQYLIDNKLTDKYVLNFPRKKPVIRKKNDLAALGIERTTDDPDVPPSLF